MVLDATRDGRKAFEKKSHPAEKVPFARAECGYPLEHLLRNPRQLARGASYIRSLPLKFGKFFMKFSVSKRTATRQACLPRTLARA